MPSPTIVDPDSLSSSTLKAQAKEAVRRGGATRLLWSKKVQALRKYDRKPLSHLSYVLFDPELENYTYDLKNWTELSAWLDDVAGEGSARFMDELLSGDAKHLHVLADKARLHPALKRHLWFNYRVGWYALCRALKPTVVVETGTHHGFGAAVLLSAAASNAAEGHPCTVISIDPRPAAGWVVPRDLRSGWIRYQDYSTRVLGDRVDSVDLLIHDSAAEAEEWELRTAASLGARYLVSNRAHLETTALPAIAEEVAAEYSFWGEVPKNHWYPGGGIGFAWGGRLGQAGRIRGADVWVDGRGPHPEPSAAGS